MQAKEKALQSELLTQLPANDVELLKDWLLQLANENREATNQLNKNLNHFKHNYAVQLIFILCDKCEQPREVKYAATELFDRFMANHIHRLFHYVKMTSKTQVERLETWNQVVERVQSQLALRIMSCIQIASKLSSYDLSITRKSAWTMLKEAEHSFSLTSVLKSEFRVLQELEYKVNLKSPATYVDALLQILRVNLKDSDLKTDDLESTIFIVLDFVYLNWRKVYDSLLKKVAGNNVLTEVDKMQFISVERDYMYLGNAIICCAASLIGHPQKELIVKQLECITSIPCEDFFEFTSTIIHAILD